MKLKRSSKIIKSKSDKAFDIGLYVISGIMLLVAAYPIYFVIIASFSSPSEVSAGNVLFYPIDVNLVGYKTMIQYTSLWIGYRNTILYAIVGTAINLCVNIPAAYALSRKDLVGNKLFTAYFLIPMFFTGGLIPTYMAIKDYGLLDTFAVMVIPFSVVTYYIIVGRTFFNNSLPDGMWEAAQIDGCGNLRFFFQIVLPLSKAVIAVIALWSAVGHWNAYFNALIYLRSDSLQPLQIIMRNILITNQTMADMLTGQAAADAREAADLIKYVVIVVSSLPIMTMYPFVQKYFNKGVMVGSMKG